MSSGAGFGKQIQPPLPLDGTWLWMSETTGSSNKPAGLSGLPHPTADASLLVSN
jgi:hypothetical protein